MRAWLTPETLPTETICRQLLIPNDIGIIAAVTGALLPLTQRENWELYGEVTPPEIAYAMLLMLDEFYTSCDPTMLNIALIYDEKSQNTGGGTFTSGAWRVRDLNSLDTLIDGVSLSSNQFTLPPGRWLIEWSAPGNLCGAHQTRLWSVTNNELIGLGTSERSISGSTQSRSFGSKIHNVISTETFRLEHRCASTVSNTGLGQPCNLANEIYTQVTCTLMSA